eukprot:12378306-Heterocapsa_arctica.AAC.1
MDPLEGSPACRSQEQKRPRPRKGYLKVDHFFQDQKPQRGRNPALGKGNVNSRLLSEPKAFFISTVAAYKGIHNSTSLSTK